MRSPAQTQECPQGLDPAEVASWAVDGEPHPCLDLRAHVPTCPVCRGIVAALAPARRAAETLRAHRVPAPPAVTTRALSRIRAEDTVSLLVRTFFGGAAQVVRALPDLLAPHSRHSANRRRR